MSISERLHLKKKPEIPHLTVLYPEAMRMDMPDTDVCPECQGVARLELVDSQSSQMIIVAEPRYHCGDCDIIYTPVDAVIRTMGLYIDALLSSSEIQII